MKRLSLVLLLVLMVRVPALAEAAPVPPADFRFTTLDGKQLRLGDVLAKGPVLILIFKTWCSTSVDELQKIKTFQTAYADKTGAFHVLAVGHNAVPRLQKFVDKNGLQILTTVEDPAPYAASRAMGARQTPTLVLLDREGRIVSSVSGWNRAKINDVSRKVAEMTRLPYAEISRDGDGMPETKPGCVILDTPEMDH